MIIPAIMPTSFNDLTEKTLSIATLTDWVQIDIMDGTFVPSQSWPYINDKGEFDRIAEGPANIPGDSSLKFEIDMMVADYKRATEDWMISHIDRLIFHLDSIGNDVAYIEDVRRRFDGEIGIAVSTTNNVEELRKYIPHIDVVQCMGIERIGFQGQKFDPRVLAQLKAVGSMCPEKTLQVDGGVSPETALMLHQAGAQNLIAGSFIWNSRSKSEAIQLLDELIS